MNDNYLWDRSGEVDPEIQQLEETLGELRYQPRPLEIPAQRRIGQRRRFYPALAIAAAIGLVAVALGLWFMIIERRTQSPEVQKPPQPKQIQNQMPQQPDQPQQVVVSQKLNPGADRKRNRESNRNAVAVNPRRPRVMTRQPQLTPAELAQKEQVLVALRLVTAKLNIAQRKAQGLPAPNSIRNQHKIG